MRLLVCGSRTYTNKEVIRQVVKDLDPDTIISGGAKGADSLAEEVADELGIYCEVYLAEWDKYGKSAGPRRNERMLRLGKPDMVVAFFDKERTRGTSHMVRIAREAHIPVLEYGLRENYRKRDSERRPK